MPPSITRLLKAVRRPARTPSDLPTARTALLGAVEDCHGLQADQIRLKIRGARHHRDLWQLRSEAYRLIALQHCQSVAEGRLRPLLPLFEGWVTPQEMSRIA